MSKCTSATWSTATFAGALESLRPDAWSYVLASEKEDIARGALVAAHAHAGLTIDLVKPDAIAAEACALAPPSDLWVATPPCEKFSRRNHGASEDDLREAADMLCAMMAYPQARRPLAIVVENVDEPAAHARNRKGRCSRSR